MIRYTLNLLTSFAISSGLLCFTPSYAQTFDTDKNCSEIIKEIDHQKSLGKSIAYGDFGRRYYFLDLGYPVPNFNFNYFPLNDLDIHLKNFEARNEGADSSGWVPIPVDRRRAYFRAEYHVKDLDIPFESLLDEIKIFYKQVMHTEKYDESSLQEVIEKSKIQMVLFPSSDFSLKYSPGLRLIGMDANKEILDWNNQERLFDYANINRNKLKKLVAVFNGTFWQGDSTRIVNDEIRPAGLILERKIIQDPIGALASIAFYKNGHFEIAPFFKLKNKDEIIELRQNEYLLLYNGEIIQEGAYPKNWYSYSDDILRSYLIATKDQEHFGYLWSNFCPPAVIGEVLRRLNFDDAMLLDLHPVVSCVLSNPTKKLDKSFSRDNSYYFVPDEREIIGWFKRKLAIMLNGSNIQYDYYVPIEGKGLEEDFFSVYVK